MGSSAEFGQQIRFGEFQLDPRTRELSRNGQTFSLQEQPFQILSALLEHPGQLVSRAELRKRLWSSSTFVDFEHGLNKAMNRLREILEDSADQPRFIETLPRQGYRFIAPVERMGTQQPSMGILAGKKVSHYRVLEILGGGGMGVVLQSRAAGAKRGLRNCSLACGSVRRACLAEHVIPMCPPHLRQALVSAGRVASRRALLHRGRGHPLGTGTERAVRRQASID
jgi:DNA-binding winged helix-turn-helix (wHTH) protein